MKKSVKKLILVGLAGVAIGLFMLMSQRLTATAQNQQTKLFDLIWSCPSQTAEMADFAGKNLITPGNNVVFVAQPAQKLNLNDYTFLWFLDRREQKNLEGPGKNYLSLQPVSIQAYEVILQVKKGDVVLQTETATFLPQNPQLLVYQGLDGAKTSFFLKKALTNDFALRTNTGFLFKAIAHYLAPSDSPQFDWQVGEARAPSSANNEFVLTIPDNVPRKENKTLRAAAVLKNNAQLEQQINLVWP